MEVDGTVSTVVIVGIGYSDAVARIREWMRRSHLGPVLVSDDTTAEELLTVIKPRRSTRRVILDSGPDVGSRQRPS